MYKAYKFRLYPNEQQVFLINKTFGCSRFVYNHFLNECKEHDIIVSESLNVKKMNQQKHLSKFILDAGFGKIIGLLK